MSLTEYFFWSFCQAAQGRAVLSCHDSPHETSSPGRPPAALEEYSKSEPVGECLQDETSFSTKFSIKQHIWSIPSHSSDLYLN